MHEIVIIDILFPTSRTLVNILCSIFDIIPQSVFTLFLYVYSNHTNCLCVTLSNVTNVCKQLNIVYSDYYVLCTLSH